MVEFALVLPLMLLLVAAAVDLGRLFYAFVAVENAAKEGALYGASEPLCADSSNINCDQPGQNVQWYVENEAAASLKNALGATQLTTTVACRAKGTGTLRQPINDCVNGDTYHVGVSYQFRMITPILSQILGQTLTLSSQQQATVVGDAYDPAGFEVLVWVDGSNAENNAAITAGCQQADSTAAPGYFYAPCQDQTNVDNYLQFQEDATVTYRVRVRNTGNINLTSISYQFTRNSSNITTPAGCGALPTSLVKGAPVAYCTFTQTATATSVGSLNDFGIGITATVSASGLPNGVTNGAGIVKVIPRPRLAVNVWASPYRLGGTGNGLSGVASYPTGPITLALDAASAEPSVREPTAWLYLSVQNQGGTANNLSVSITRNGSGISLASCTIPTSLATYGTVGDTFTCIVPVTFTTTGAYTILGTATATNSVSVGGTQPSVVATLNTCTTAGEKPVPNLVDTLNPSADGSAKTFSEARNAWQNAGFDNNNVTSSPAGASGSAKVTSQDRTAHSCAATTSTVTVTTQ